MKQRALRWPKLNVFCVFHFSDNFNYVIYSSISIERINKKGNYVFIQTIKFIQNSLKRPMVPNSSTCEFCISWNEVRDKTKAKHRHLALKEKNKKMRRKGKWKPFVRSNLFLFTLLLRQFCHKAHACIEYKWHRGQKYPTWRANRREKKPWTRHYENVVPRLFVVFQYSGRSDTDHSTIHSFVIELETTQIFQVF